LVVFGSENAKNHGKNHFPHGYFGNTCGVCDDPRRVWGCLRPGAGNPGGVRARILLGWCRGGKNLSTTLENLSQLEKPKTNIHAMPKISERLAGDWAGWQRDTGTVAGGPTVRNRNQKHPAEDGPIRQRLEI
jgi:hypothetical protein